MELRSDRKRASYWESCTPRYKRSSLFSLGDSLHSFFPCRWFGQMMEAHPPQTWYDMKYDKSMIKVKEVWIDPFPKFHTDFPKTVLDFLEREVFSQVVSHDTKKTFYIIRCACSWVLWGYTGLYIINPLLLSTFDVSRHSYQRLPCEATDIGNVPAYLE